MPSFPLASFGRELLLLHFPFSHQTIGASSPSKQSHYCVQLSKEVSALVIVDCCLNDYCHGEPLGDSKKLNEGDDENEKKTLESRFGQEKQLPEAETREQISHKRMPMSSTINGHDAGRLG